MMAGIAVAQQATQNPGEIKPSQYRKDANDRGASSQTDRSTSQQSDRSGTAGSTQSSSAQRRTANFRGTPAAAGDHQQELNHYFATCLLDKNKAEIEMAQLAQKQSENPEVKQFAEMLIKDHQEVVQKLQQQAGTKGANQSRSNLNRDRNSTNTSATIDAAATNPDRTNSDANSLNAAGETASATSDSSQQGGGALMQLAAIEKQINERCKQAMRDELQQKQGAEFDECFVGSQIGGHTQMLAALEVLSQQGPGEVQQIAADAKPKVQQHLEHAKQLAEQLKSSRTQAGQANRETTRTQR
jgi:predicted outer membrane protein